MAEPEGVVKVVGRAPGEVIQTGQAGPATDPAVAEEIILHQSSGLSSVQRELACVPSTALSAASSFSVHLARITDEKGASIAEAPF